MARIYNFEAGEVCTSEKGWIPYKEYKSGVFTVIQYSPVFVDEDGTQGQEDFSPERWLEAHPVTKTYWIELKLYEQRENKRRTSIDTKYCGVWEGLRGDVIKHIRNIHQSELSNGYEVSCV